jgi:hypothetical protein
MYPVTIVDNFFEDPDAIVELTDAMRFYPPETGNWPGSRTKQLHVENERLFNYVGEKIHLLFHDTAPEYWKLQAHFQKIAPFHEQKWNKKNRGWIHQDIDTHFGGIIYLTKDPEPDTGTSVYRTKDGYSLQTKDEISVKEKLYLGTLDKTQEEYDEIYDRVHNQYIETVKVENVYNRLVMFSGQTHHGVQTFGTKERLTLNFFGIDMTGKLPPLMRTR